MAGDIKILTQKLRKALAQAPHLPRALRLVWQAARAWMVAWITLLIFQGLLPAAAVYLTKLIVDGLVTTLRAGSPWAEVRSVLILVAALGSLLVMMQVVSSAIGWVRTVQAELLQDHINHLIHTKSVTADLAFYEFPDYYDHLHRARSEASYRPVALLENLGSLLQNGITLIAMSAILIPLGPWLSLALLVSTLPAFLVVLRYAIAQYQWRIRSTQDERRIWYLDWLMTAGETAAELRLFGLGNYFQKAYKALRQKLRTGRLKIARHQSVAELAAGVFALLITGAVLTWMVWKALRGLITLGDLALIYTAFNQGQRLMRTLLENVGQLYANSLFLGNLFEFLSLSPIVTEAPVEKAKTIAEVRHQISFVDVSFSYPQSERKVLEDFRLTIPAGQIAALVGPNGAGKTTLIKLLCRFYDPARGRIEIDGVDLRDLPVQHLHRLITVLFQRPVHYNTTIHENVSYGNLEHYPTLSEIEIAIQAAGAEEIVARLPQGYESLLGKWFAGGTELSVGEWQRVALARAFLRRAPIIILDEPTSSLDPWAEADWLQRFRHLAWRRTAIIITHRFTTAMHADVIHVMDSGRIVESGTHEELIDQNGRYAESWATQMRVVEVALAQRA
jgi:ATP-binding cassette, subfamily B, bacterial